MTPLVFVPPLIKTPTEERNSGNPPCHRKLWHNKPLHRDRVPCIIALDAWRTLQRTICKSHRHTDMTWPSGNSESSSSRPAWPEQTRAECSLNAHPGRLRRETWKLRLRKNEQMFGKPLKCKRGNNRRRKSILTATTRCSEVFVHFRTSLGYFGADRRKKNWRRDGKGQLNPTHSLSQTANVYVAGDDR